ncbi:hypothetical protein A5662_24920 [Mycobacteriaceae bacterium 1482268.1]|nr:hypothetical protein A5662_24920 [Mycobacteriaceae bacterium 1482268.1]
MTNTPQGDGPDPTQPLGPSNPGYPDPAYAGQYPYGPAYQSPPDPTRQLPPVSPYGYDPYGTGQYATGQYGPPYPPGEPPEGPPPPKSPRWLWVAAAVAVLLVVGLVIALVIVNSSKQDTVVAPPPMPEPTKTTTRTPSTTTRRPLPPVVPVPPPSTPTTTTPPSESAAPGATESVVYEVTGTGRAINITYVDTGSLLQTEFNVMLPWRKEVELPSPAEESASVTIINVGRQVSCTVTVNGVQMEANTGNGLTICTAAR